MWPRAGIGRQSGLKIQWDLFPWRFESARGYQKPDINHIIMSLNLDDSVIYVYLKLS